MNTTLNIPLRQSLTRHTFWRVLRVVGIVCAAWGTVIGAHRVLSHFNTLATPEHVAVVQLTHNTRTAAHLRSLARGALIIPGVPLSIDDALTRSRAGITVWIDSATQSPLAVLDTILSDADIRSLESFGATVLVDTQHHQTAIANQHIAPPPHTTIFSALFRALASGSDGTITTQNTRIDFDITGSRITVYAGNILLPAITTLPIDADTVFSAHIPPHTLTSLASRIFTENTPGLAALFRYAELSGISAHINAAETVPTYTFTVPLTQEHNSPPFTERILTQLATEIVDIPTITSVPAFSQAGERILQLRPSEKAVVVIRNEPPYRFLTATASQKTVFLTQTPSSLTVSNAREASLAPATLPAQCLPGATAFVLPQKLFSSPTQTHYQSPTIFSLLWKARGIASTPSRTRICIGE